MAYQTFNLITKFDTHSFTDALNFWSPIDNLCIVICCREIPFNTYNFQAINTRIATPSLSGPGSNDNNKHSTPSKVLELESQHRMQLLSYPEYSFWFGLFCLMAYQPLWGI